MTMQFTLSSNVKTMTSREIAELCEKQHASVLRTISFLQESDSLHGVSKKYQHPKTGDSHDEWVFDKNNSLILVARLEPKFMAAVVTRWQELESQVTQLTNTDLLRLGYEAAQERDKLQLVIQEQAPKVKAFEELEASDGTMSITMAAKALSLIPAKTLFTWLVDIGWINRKRGEKDKEEWECKAYAIERCFMESIARVVKPKNKPSFVVMQPVVTAKGLSHLAKTKDAYFSRLYSRSLAA
jgi:phage regulator Rha-like protein